MSNTQALQRNALVTQTQARFILGGISRTTFFRWSKLPHFPKSVRVVPGKSQPKYRANDFDAFIRELPEEAKPGNLAATIASIAVRREKREKVAALNAKFRGDR